MRVYAPIRASPDGPHPFEHVDVYAAVMSHGVPVNRMMRPLHDAGFTERQKIENRSQAIDRIDAAYIENLLGARRHNEQHFDQNRAIPHDEEPVLLDGSIKPARTIGQNGWPCIPRNNG